METKEDLWEKLKKSKKNIVIYGMGDGCDKILKVCKEKGIPISGIFASDEYVRGQTVHGFQITTYSEIKNKYREIIVLLAFGVFRPDLMEHIKKIAKETEFYAPDVPLFGSTLFCRDTYVKNKDRFAEVRKMFSDDFSRFVFGSVLEYKYSGKTEPLFRCETKKEDDLKTLVPFRSQDCYVDLGAYDGDTVLEWDRLHPDHGEILAMEPNPKTFRKLLENTKGISGFRAVEGAAWNRNESLRFNGKSGRSAGIDSNGKNTVAGFPLDEICPRADFIKFDVEGAEREAIEGAAKLIREQAPTLCISAYHRSEDLFDIPLLVKQLRPDYRVYLRHQPYIPAWDTVFYFTVR